MIVRLSNGSEIICPIPGTVITSAMDVDLCIDGFVGPGTHSTSSTCQFRWMSFLSGHNASLVFDGAQDSREELVPPAFTNGPGQIQQTNYHARRAIASGGRQRPIDRACGVCRAECFADQHVGSVRDPSHDHGICHARAQRGRSQKQYSSSGRLGVGSSVLVGHAAAASGNSQRSEVAASDATGVWVVHSGTADASQNTGASACGSENRPTDL